MKKALSLLLTFSLIWCAFVFTVNAENEEAVKEILFTPNTTLTVTSGSSCVLSEQGYLHITSNAGGTQHVQISLEGINVSEYPYIVFNYRYTTGSDYNGGVEVVSNGGVHSGIGGNLLTDGKWHTRMLYLPSLISGLDSSYSASYFILPVPNEAGKTVDISALAFCKTAEDAEDSAGNIVPLNETYGVYLPNPNNIIGIQTSAIYNEENGYLTVTRTEGDKNNDAHIAFAIDVNPSETPYIVFKYRLNDNDYSDSFSHLATNGSNYADFNYATPLKADGEWHTSVYYIPTCFPTVIYEHINGFMLPAPWNNGGTLDIEYIRFFENVESVEAFIGECDHCDAVNGICSCGWTEPARITNIDGKEFYKIANAGNLIDFGNMIATSWLGKELNGILVADIDLSSVCSEESGKSWTPIVSNGSRGWRGTFDGNGHTISNLYIYNPDGSRLGLFTELVRTDNLNPIIENLIITGIVIGGSSTGGICGANDGGIIRNCISLVHATGTKTTSSVGAICGYTDSGKVQNCFYMYGEVGYQGVNYEFGANGEAGTVSDVYKKTEEEFASGEVAYMLNGSADAGAWKQIIGTDALPYIEGCVAGNVYKNDSVYENRDSHNYGEWIESDESQHVCICDCGAIEYEKHTWDNGTEETPATHTTYGTMIYTCTKCEAEKHENIDKLTDHSFCDWVREDENQHKCTCECGETEYASHKWDNGQITRQPTTEKEGQITYTCSDCLAVKYGSIDKLPEETTVEETTVEETTVEETTTEATVTEATTAVETVTDESSVEETSTEIIAEETTISESKTYEQTEGGNTQTSDEETSSDSAEKGGCGSSIGLVFLIIPFAAVPIIGKKKRNII